MILYEKTYENIKTENQNFPIEDCFYSSDNLVVIADGITRDPIGIDDFSGVNFQTFLDCYPRPSGAELAAKEICFTFQNYGKVSSLLEVMKQANYQVSLLNQKYISNCDYLVNDYYGAVCSSILIHDNILDYAYICDCGVIVYDKDGNIKFQTEDDKKQVDFYIDKIGISWNLPLARAIVRRDYRNKPNHYIDGNLASYGAFTGEEEAISFIKTGSISLDKDDIVIVYSDGFSEYFKRDDFSFHLEYLKQGKIDDFESYIKKVSFLDYEKFGKEKTIVVISV